MKVYKAINEVQKALSKVGIAKDRTNTQGATYKFRGIDDVYNALSPLLAEFGLCILPRMLTRSCEERQSKSGNALFYVTVQAEFDFVSAEDGSKHTVATFGEAMDSGDKATNKAMSAAYKYAAFQAFAIPTEGDNDADSSTHEVRINPVKEAAKIAKKGIPEDRQQELQEMAISAVNYWKINNQDRMMELVREVEDNEEKVYFWDLLQTEPAMRKYITSQTRGK